MIQLNPKFYSEQAINETITAYKDICDAKIENNTITLTPKTDISDEKLKNEFCNYCLSLIT
ncbi:hypothetical protein HN695_07290 [Candidatus Woesearchaeota archaeon]|nr:hypothetical protein [Candidatus Woesearchaeota archaeon]MBT6041116.1 hypothetical protein [Candidatus Woesearchaeota archaeon]MBT6336738.1 hypothetical protein [Candidatus Woesearchaeota archaeon]MBT7928111.1 hypothetical protein [Candidatus Woesearchaeota archaeon]